MTPVEPLSGTSGTSRITRVAAPLRQELLGQVREAITSGEHKPGERLVERVLCDRYGVSRTVVREVLRHLEAEGLVTILPNRGPVVTVLTREDAASLFEVRAALEALAAERFAERASDVDRAALRAACDGVDEAFESGDIQRWLHAKDDFYDVLLSGAHNPLIRSTVVGIHARVQVLRGLSLQAPDRPASSRVEIRLITDLAVAGKAAEAAAAAKAHVESAAAAAFSQMPESSEPSAQLR